MRRAVHSSCASNPIVAPLCALLVSWGIEHIARADPLPGEVLKFQQLPLDATPVPRPQGTAGTYWGHDEPSTVDLLTGTQPLQGTGTFMADDFADHVTSDIVHVSWWGSYFNNQLGNGGVKQFLIAFESDVPVSPSNPNFSHPGTVLSAQVVNVAAGLTPLSGTYTETLVSAGGAPLGEHLYHYNAELHVPFHENAETVYWLKIAALVDTSRDTNILWGWHDRDYTTHDLLASTPPLVSPGERDLAAPTDPFGPVWHFQDDAVAGNMGVLLDPATFNVLQVSQTNYNPQNYLDTIDGPSGISQFSKDLAFELYYVPEPVSATLLATGVLIMPRRRSRRALTPAPQK